MFYYPGPVANPLKNKNAHINITKGSDTKTIFHSHPSGYRHRTYLTDLGSVTDEAYYNQPPSPHDVEESGNAVEYVFARGEKKVYIYNSSGVQAVISMRKYKKIK